MAVAPSTEMNMRQEATALTLYLWSVSPFVKKVQMILGYKGLSYQKAHMPVTSRPLLQKQVGTQQVPVLADGDTWISDSTDIAVHLEELCPEPTIYPVDPLEREQCLLLEDWADETLTIQAHWAMWCCADNGMEILKTAADEAPSFGSWIACQAASRLLPGAFRKFEKRRGGPEKMQAFFERQLDMLERMLARREFLCADRPTVADFAVAGQLANFLIYPGGESVLERSNLRRMVETLVGYIDEDAQLGRPTLTEGASPSNAHHSCLT